MSVRRVRRPAQHETLMKRLTGDDGPFSTLAEVLTFAAGLGYAEDRRTPYASSGEPIDYDVFERLGAVGFIDMLATSVDDNVAILGRDRGDDRLTIFEEFANGGLDVLETRLQNSQADLDSLLGIVLDRERSLKEGSPEEVDFEAVVDELTR